jgi:hypothetical protein
MSFMASIHLILSGCLSKEDVVGGTRGTHGGGERCVQVLVGRPKGRNHWDEKYIGGRITLRWTSRRW